MEMFLDVYSIELGKKLPGCDKHTNTHRRRESLSQMCLRLGEVWLVIAHWRLRQKKCKANFLLNYLHSLSLLIFYCAATQLGHWTPWDDQATANNLNSYFFRPCKIVRLWICKDDITNGIWNGVELDGGKNESQASRNLNLTGHLVGWFNLVGGRGLITEHLTGRPGSKTDRTRGTERAGI